MGILLKEELYNFCHSGVLRVSLKRGNHSQSEVKRVQKRGQAAMEFLMTYGWALLVVLIAIGALAYFGVLNPSKFLPNSCSLAPGFSCSNFKASASTNVITIVVQNGLGDNLNTVNLYLSNVQGATCPATAFAPASTTINDGSSVQFTLGCTAGTLVKGTKLKSDLQIDYYKGTSAIQHKKMGQLVVGIEA
ncbi:MAG: hypothetical protein Q8L34_06050 [Candidatus Woesearchaeota archaeon]|nr:hypothetical protein [Candidatus Woesearchaeota archaeon]